MTNMLFASNNLAHWPLSTSSILAGTYDSTRVPYSFMLAYEETMSSPEFTPAVGDVTWLHHRVWMDTASFNDSFTYITVFDAAGNVLFKLTKIAQVNPYVCTITLYNEVTTTTNGMSFPFNQSTVNSVDFKYETGASLIKVEMFLNGALVATASFTDTNTSGFGQPAYFSVGTAFSSAGGKMYFSEFIVADGDTRNARMNLLRATASGGETDWLGSASDLADDDPTSGMTTMLVDQRQTLDLTAYTGAQNISAVLIVTQSLAGANGPQNMRHTVRMGAVNYDSPADFPLGDTLQFNATDYQINPATSLPWVGGDLSTMEMGFVSKT